MKCPMKHLTGVKLVPENDVSLLATNRHIGSTKYIDSHIKLFHANDKVVKNIGRILNWKIDDNQKEPCVALLWGKQNK